MFYMMYTYLAGGDDEDEYGTLPFPTDGYEGDTDIPDDDVEVGINPIIRTIDRDGNEQYYDLGGRKLSNSKSRKGVYIYNGKKSIK